MRFAYLISTENLRSLEAAKRPLQVAGKCRELADVPKGVGAVEFVAKSPQPMPDVYAEFPAYIGYVLKL